MSKVIRFIKRQYYKIFHYESRMDNSGFGKFRVLYPDGKKSEPMCYGVAKDYAMLFDGKVIDNF